MRDNEKEWLSDHLGHTLGVHKSHYRLQEPVVEMSQLSRLLLAIESGEASQFVGKKLSEIRVSGEYLPLLSLIACCFGNEIFVSKFGVLDLLSCNKQPSDYCLAGIFVSVHGHLFIGVGVPDDDTDVELVGDSAAAAEFELEMER